MQKQTIKPRRNVKHLGRAIRGNAGAVPKKIQTLIKAQERNRATSATPDQKVYKTAKLIRSLTN
jgi:hypothetical protein